MRSVRVMGTTFPTETDSFRDLVGIVTPEVHVEVRHHRHEANDHIKKEAKASGISADDEKRALEEVQKLTDRSISEVESILKTKETEIMAR